MSTEPTVRNDYLNEVLVEQAQVEQELKRQQAPLTKSKSRARDGETSVDYCLVSEFAPGDVPAGRAIGYRVTGFWHWKTVVVPPNVYVVQTRRGHPEPITLGLGTSFRFDPATDAFLLIPASMQTIVINAKCITAERQGVLVQAYVQWIIEDLATAYRRLDFSDPIDPMRVVNVQLREQAEAVIKDKVATMTIDQVLNDKLPIIEELTQRLRLLAEGTSTGRDVSGLGLKIVTVQIKEAVVSSARLWENLQKPFRAGREEVARLAEMETERRLAERRAAIEQERYNRDQAERGRRHGLEQEAERLALDERNRTEMARKAAALELTLKELELEAKRIEQEIDSLGRQTGLDEAKHEQRRRQALADLQLEEERSKAEAVRVEREVALLKARRAVENDLTEGLVKARLIERLPEIAAALPKPEEMRTVSIGGDGGGASPLLGFLAGALGLAEGALKKSAGANGTPG
jgi:regulator of protease activity HflC (stomatin/prohibitin superfamily)